MCGIAGIYRFEGSTAELTGCLETMNRALVHRGPDQAGIHVDPDWSAGLAVRRLSIVDPENGLQPMFSEDRSIAVVCNGEIYNHRELRRELERKGYRLRSHSDGEVISHLYLEEGVGFLKRLHGMFALAVLDRRDGSLLLARDPVGMKHLYWSETPRGFAFSSEARALFAAGLLTPAPDWASLSTFFSTGWVQSPRTAFENLQRLRPGSFLRISPEGCEEGRYWVPRYQSTGEQRGLEDWSAELREILDRAVATHLDTDVPAGLFLSGGWDSSLVSLYASRQSAEPLNSYSLAFPDHPGVDESAYAKQVAEQAGTRGHRIELRDADIRDVLLQTSRALEEPVVTCPTALGFLLSRAASRDRKVVLGGEGADEVFAGYGRFEVSPLHRLRSLVPHRLVPSSLPLPLNQKWSRALRFLAAGDEERAHLILNTFLQPRQYVDLFRPDIPLEPHPGPEVVTVSDETRSTFRDPLDLKLSVEFTSRLADGILFSIDKTSMAHSLEVRMPFLDRDVVDFAHRLPSRYKVRGRDMKVVLAPLARELPPDVARRRKKGLHVPPRTYRSELFRSFYRETILETSLASGLFDHERLERWVDARAGRSDARASELWPLCHFCLWWNNFMDGNTRV